MNITSAQLSTCTGATSALAVRWLPHVQEALDAYMIDTRERIAAFLANVGHESGGLRYTTELWGPTDAQRGYEGRADLGNTQAGDGSRYRGHGLIQTTGRANHARARDRLRARFPDMVIPDFEDSPELLAADEWAALSAADFWDDHNLNTWADMGSFDGVCDIINRGHKTRPEGDANGYPERLRLFNAALAVLS